MTNSLQLYIFLLVIFQNPITMKEAQINNYEMLSY